MIVYSKDSEKKSSTKKNRSKRKLIGFDKKRNAIKVRGVKTSIWRIAVQGIFTLLSLGIGIQFFRFVMAAKNTVEGPLPIRPPGVEGYLPISGLMGWLDWFHQGELNRIHPAATILFIAFVLLAFLIRKSFCGWICPAGFISENLARVGQLLFKKNVLLPFWLDIPLRGIKYIILFFFVFMIFFAMTPVELHEFISSPYNKISDIKMMEFFPNMTMFGWSVMAILTILSVVVNSFWCRYLCPYGALMGIVSFFSPSKVRRSDELCTDCGICDKVCMARLPVSKKESINSVECIGCTDCVVSCPVPGALEFGLKKQKLSPFSISIIVIAIFTLIVGLAKFTDNWQNDLSDDEVRHHVLHMNDAEYGHPGMKEE
jgi:Fe-S-cluster-containing hydrogenase component 2